MDQAISGCLESVSNTIVKETPVAPVAQDRTLFRAQGRPLTLTSVTPVNSWTDSPAMRLRGMRDVAERLLNVATLGADIVERLISLLVLKAIAGVGAGQGAQRQQPRHEASIRVRFAGRDKLVYLIGEGEAPPRRWWGFAERLDGAAQIGQGFPDGNQPVALTLHALFSHASQTRQGYHHRQRGEDAVTGIQLSTGRCTSGPSSPARPASRSE